MSCSLVYLYTRTTIITLVPPSLMSSIRTCCPQSVISGFIMLLKYTAKLSVKIIYNGFHFLKRDISFNGDMSQDLNRN
jgi:hypothetical protein